ncbi:hypothetical protein DPMN_193256 [Dreissena polymorpha]|uniref:Uncharacterized protein n=1 Tax=Dreissena polymorpha TaxID=45954 RepID=A0A9D4B896_DREPO|nr:hypothetical protein DPMN_193256 [Dreissena polymorpha]
MSVCRSVGLWGGPSTRWFPDDNSRTFGPRIMKLHSRCTPVKVISKVKRQSSDVKKLSVKVLKTLSRLKKLQGYREDSRRSMQVCYAELEQNMVETMQLNIQSFLVQCEDNSVNETHAHVEYSVDEMRQKIYSLLAEFENSAIKENKEELTLKQAPLLSVINTCIRHHIELLRVYEALRKVKDRTELSLITRYKCQDKIQQSEIYMNENFSDEVFTIQGKSTHNVRMSSDSKTCWITAMLVLPDGQFLVADWGNHKVKLLNQQYQVVSHCGVSAQSICQITPSEVAVTVDDWINTHEVQFITFNQSQLVTGRHFQLQHDCYGIAHHQGDLFICSGNAMFKYSLSGELICKLYEDASGFVTVWGFAMSHTGDKLYITSPSHHKLYTVARDGTLLAVFTDPELQYPQNVYVTPAGQVLVCGMLSHTIVQMDSEGKRKLATLVSVRDGVGRPCSVCYSSTTSSIIVGLLGDDNIMVFRVE